MNRRERVARAICNATCGSEAAWSAIYGEDRDAWYAAADAAMAVGPREEDVRRVALVIRRNDVQTREDELAADRILAALDAPAPCQHKHTTHFSDGDGSRCQDCGALYEPGHGWRPASEPCPTPEHDWQDYGGASFYCPKCKQSYHPSWGEMPPCKPPCPTCGNGNYVGATGGRLRECPRCCGGAKED